MSESCDSSVVDSTTMDKIDGIEEQKEATKSTKPTISTALRHLRSSYADNFLAKCTPVQPDDFNLPFGTYICPWMPENPEEETCYNINKGLVECRKCGETFDEYSSQRNEHKSDHEIAMLNRIIATSNLVRKKMQDATKSAGDDEKSLEEVTAERDSLQDELEAFQKDPWKHIPLEDAEANRDDYFEYWAPRCETKSLSLFAAHVHRRPDIEMSTKLRKENEVKKMDFGSLCFQASLLPSTKTTFPRISPCAVQAAWIPLNDFLSEEIGSPQWNTDFADPRYRMGLIYTKDGVWAYNQRQTWRNEKKVFRPFVPHFSVPMGGVNQKISAQTKVAKLLCQQHGGPNADVWTMEDTSIISQIKPQLQELANRTNDRPIPRYQMIIDPNQFVRTRKNDGNKVWVPSEFDVAPDGDKVSLVAGNRAHWMDTSLVDSIATPVLSAALPLLAKLTKPYLLLEGQRLQVVVKAQSITVPKKQSDDDDPEYIGLWHVDGEHEPVAAIVLYYYDVDEALVGGSMEFMDRRPIAVLGSGDTDLPRDFPPGRLKEALRPGTDTDRTQSSSPLIPNCSVPVKTGTMLVFSNYQMAHRVLKMVNTSQEHPASRKFVALFVMDPAAERLVPARCHLARSYLYRRAITGKCDALVKDNVAPQDSLPDAAAEVILEYLGIVPSIKQRRRTRNEMLRSQLTPKHLLGGSQYMVYSTGNGCLTMIGWIDSMLKQDEKEKEGTFDSVTYHGNDFIKPEARINALNFPPNQIGRGLSETLSIPSDDLDLQPFFDTIDRRKVQLIEDMNKIDNNACEE